MSVHCTGETWTAEIVFSVMMFRCRFLRHTVDSLAPIHKPAELGESPQRTGWGRQHGGLHYWCWHFADGDMNRYVSKHTMLTYWYDLICAIIHTSSNIKYQYKIVPCFMQTNKFTPRNCTITERQKIQIIKTLETVIDCMWNDWLCHKHEHHTHN